MKKTIQKIRPIFRRMAKYFFDFFVVFIGVFLAFWLNSQKEEQNKIDQQDQLFKAIYEDINAFYSSGRVENPEGFINLFENYKTNIDSLVAIKETPVHRRLFGDYWQLEIINSLLKSGQLKDMDPKLFKAFAKFNTLHQQFLDEIDGFNANYETYITKPYARGVEHLYKPDSNELTETAQIPLKRLDHIIDLSRMLVDISENIVFQYNEEYKFEAD